MLIWGVGLIAHGLFSKHMRIRAGGKFRAVIAKKRWQIVYMRCFWVLLGVAIINFALASGSPNK